MRFGRFGGPEVLEEADVPDPLAGPGETLVQVEAAGVNFGDIKQIAGEHTAGEALAVLVQGLTAWHLLRGSVARIRPGESVVVHAAAGGTGSLVVQLAREFGAGRIIATASSDEKRAFALELGADAAIDGDAEGYRERVLDANHGHPVDTVLDAIGGPVLDAGLDALGHLGRLVTYGASSRQTASAIAPSRLAVDNITVAGFWVIPLIARNGAGGAELAELLDLTARRRLRPLVGAEYELARARDAHEDLLGRHTKGKLVLRP
jgi:NADPH2:quinone reductase